MEKEKMTIVLFSGELDKALAAFTLATTAASSGMDVSIFFTFWGLSVIKKKKTKMSGNWMQKMMGALNRGLPLSKLNMLGMGPFMMKILMKQKNMADLDMLMSTARMLGVKYIGCTTSCGVMGFNRENLIPEVDVMAGASTYLAEALKSKINLFI